MPDSEALKLIANGGSFGLLAVIAVWIMFRVVPMLQATLTGIEMKHAEERKAADMRCIEERKEIMKSLKEELKLNREAWQEESRLNRQSRQEQSNACQGRGMKHMEHL